MALDTSSRLIRTVTREPDAARDGIVARVHERLVTDLNVGALDSMPEDERRGQVEAAVGRMLAEISPNIAGVVRQEIVAEVVDEVLGFGPIQPLLDDPE